LASRQAKVARSRGDPHREHGVAEGLRDDGVDVIEPVAQIAMQIETGNAGRNAIAIWTATLS
jgi:hypothetical protein